MEEGKTYVSKQWLTWIGVALAVLAGIYIGFRVSAGPSENDEPTDIPVAAEDVDVLPDGKGLDPTLETAGKYGASGEVVLWRDVEGAFTVAVPAEWEIRQNDAGSVRFIEVFSPNNINEVFTVWVQRAKRSDSRAITLNEWIDASVTGLSDIVACDGATIGGRKMVCRHAANQKSLWNMYFAELNENEHIGVFYSDVPENPVMQGIVESLTIDPTVQQLEQAQIIP